MLGIVEFKWYTLYVSNIKCRHFGHVPRPYIDYWLNIIVNDCRHRNDRVNVFNQIRHIHFTGQSKKEISQASFCSLIAGNFRFEYLIVNESVNQRQGNWISLTLIELLHLPSPYWSSSIDSYMFDVLSTSQGLANLPLSRSLVASFRFAIWCDVSRPCADNFSISPMANSPARLHHKHSSITLHPFQII